MDQPLSPSPQQFAGMGVTLTVWPDHLELYRTSWWRWPPWQPARTTLRRGDLVEYRVLPWGPAVLLVLQDGHARTLALGAASAAACAALASMASESCGQSSHGWLGGVKDRDDDSAA
jgi:hypothetical protein